MKSRFPMMRRLALVLLLAGWMGVPVRAADRLSIRLKAAAAVDHETVVLGDIAQVSGGSAATISRVQSLDLAALASDGESETITARHVQARLLLEGIDPRTVTVSGASQAKVKREATAVISGPHSYEDEVLAQVVEALAKAWLASPDDIEVQVVATQTRFEMPAGSTVVPELELPSRLEPGKIHARVKWMNQGKPERVEPVSFEARLRQTVVLAAHKIDRGIPLKPQDVIEDRRLLDKRVEQVRAEQVVGYVSKRSINQGEQLQAKDLASPRTAPVIQPRQGVKVVARKGTLAVTLQMAQALEAGNVGDVIQLRNLQSGQVIAGRVVSSQLVEIPLP